jgi:hypothetical protein
MSEETLSGAPGPKDRTFKAEDGRVLEVPESWALLPPGDAGLTRRVKAAGPSWSMHEKRGRKAFSKGVWAPARNILAAMEKLEADRSTDAWVKRAEKDKERREAKQEAYVEDFAGAVLTFLRFHERHDEVAARLAAAVTLHATPVGSGTVARTERVPIEDRAEMAVIAWMRHQTTAYDNMSIARVKGERREVRRQLAQRSRMLLDRYRRGDEVDPATCLLQKALDKALPVASAPAGDPA